MNVSCPSPSPNKREKREEDGLGLLSLNLVFRWLQKFWSSAYHICQQLASFFVDLELSLSPPLPLFVRVYIFLTSLWMWRSKEPWNVLGLHVDYIQKNDLSTLITRFPFTFPLAFWTSDHGGAEFGPCLSCHHPRNSLLWTQHHKNYWVLCLVLLTLLIVSVRSFQSCVLK